jgi:uroporphyrinogen-III synthase
VPPLDHVRILITRTRTQASELAAQLESLGAETILIPTIEIAPPTSCCVLDAALASLRSFDWLLFTSANAVDCFIERARQQGIAPHPKRIAAIGPATAKAVERQGLSVNLIPPTYIAESLAEALTPEASGKRFLLARAEEARDILPEALTAAGATVTIAPTYRNQTPPEAIPALQSLFANPTNYPNVITFTSSSTARNLLTLLESAEVTLPPATILASIGPITSQTLRDLGHTPTLEAAEPTVAALTEVIVAHQKSSSYP